MDGVVILFLRARDMFLGTESDANGVFLSAFFCCSAASIGLAGVVL